MMNVFDGIFQGLCVAILGPTLLDVALLVNISIKEVSYGFVVNQGAFCLSSLIWGWAFNRVVSRELGLILSLVMCCLSVICIPFCREILTYLIAMGFLGASFAGLDIATSAWIIEIWKENSNTYLQLLYFLASIGNTVSPIMSAPFLAPEGEGLSHLETGNASTTFSPNSSSVIITENITADVSKSRIEIPFGVCAVITLFSIIIQVILYFKFNTKHKSVDISPEVQQSDTKQNGDHGQSALDSNDETQSKVYYWSIITVGSLLFCFFICTIENTRNYLPAFVVNCNLKLSKSTGSYMSSAFIGAFTLARLCSIFIAAKLKASHMLIADFILVIAGNIIVLFSANSWELGLWIGFVIMGIGSASCVGAMYAMIEERIVVDNFVCGIMMFGSAIATTISPLFNGDFLEGFPVIYIIINLSSLAVCIVLYFSIFIIDMLKVRKPEDKLSNAS
ncbi:Major facilitator superfamily domain-containing protein 4A [Halotydeus destructor]|nr:Major facilitator superfamily domain-containing protein 4A [Halotydeus destructor]